MSGVPLKAMCSIMWARPVLESGSCDEPVSTMVKNEKTGASSRRKIRTVNPFGSVFTVTRFSNEARSWAASGSAAASRRVNRNRPVARAKLRFIVPPKIEAIGNRKYSVRRCGGAMGSSALPPGSMM